VTRRLLGERLTGERIVPDSGTTAKDSAASPRFMTPV
jgi:hypothetical protein